MKIDTLSLGDYQTNCYIVRADASETCVLIDPGYEPEKILAWLRKENLALDAILLTHGHFDHVGAVRALVDATGCALWIHPGDHVKPQNPTNAFFYPLANGAFPRLCFSEDAVKIQAGGLCFTVRETPGHTDGSVCYFCEDAMFSGDTLFEGSCGRTDLPGGDPARLRRSLCELNALEEAYRVYPGHGFSTTLSEEKRFNPYLKGIL